MLDSTQIKRFIEIWETSPNRHQAQKRMLADDLISLGPATYWSAASPRQRMMYIFRTLRDKYGVELRDLPMGEADRLNDQREERAHENARRGSALVRYADAVRELAAAEAALG